MGKDEISEFELIDWIRARTGPHPRSVVGPGDDCAVLDLGGRGICLVTTDALVEDVHFKLSDASPEQIGHKAIACGLSDIAAMGGTPTYALLSIALTRDINVEFVDGLYERIYGVADRYRVDVIGGDTTHGAKIVINVSLMGETDGQHLCLRSGARPGYS